MLFEYKVHIFFFSVLVILLWSEFGPEKKKTKLEKEHKKRENNGRPMITEFVVAGELFEW